MVGAPINHQHGRLHGGGEADEIEALIEAAKGNRQGHRDATMILLTYGRGLRTAEVRDLRWDQVDFRLGRAPARGRCAGCGPGKTANSRDN
jgi:site-specific recombinase XerC